VHDGYGLITALQNGFPRLVGQCDLMLEEVRRSERVVATDFTSRLELFLEDWGVQLFRLTSRVFQVAVVTHIRVVNEELCWRRQRGKKGDH
jgi:hypothetical protein